MKINVYALVVVINLIICEPQEHSFDLWDIIRETEGKCNGTTQNSTGCKCDPLCASYGDCCKDSEYFLESEQRVGASRFTCIKLLPSSHHGLYLITNCPVGWNISKVRGHCENPKTDYSDPLFEAPVTSSRTNNTYRNSYCAVCNNDFLPDEDHVWPINFVCDSWVSIPTSTNLVRRLSYDSKTEKWNLNLSGISVAKRVNFFSDYSEQSPYYDYEEEENTISCVPLPVVPPSTRLCEPDIVQACAGNWTDLQVKRECEAYTAHICIGQRTYRNYHCAKCNNLHPLSIDLCFPVSTYLKSATAPTFSILLDWHKTKDKNLCNETTIHDPLSNTCRSIHTTVKEEIVNSTGSLDTCEKLSFTTDEYIFNQGDDTIYIPAQNTTYEPREYYISNSSLLFVCVLEKQAVEDEVLQYITTMGLSLSIIFLLLHLTVFIFSPKNLSSMNLASLCVSLLILYTMFMTSGLLKPLTTSCIVTAILIHYSLLTSFHWMLVISFDIWRALREATTKLRAVTGVQWKRFVVYSAWSWLLPGVIVGVAVPLEDSSVAPEYGTWRCWIGNANALLVFVIGPLVTIMACNLMFYCWSAYMIYSTNADTTGTRTNFQLYTRLAFIMGLTWIIGLFAGHVNFKGLWYAFAILNTLQGFFIFVAFTCSTKMKKQMRILVPCIKKKETQTSTITSVTSTEDKS